MICQMLLSVSEVTIVVGSLGFWQQTSVAFQPFLPGLFCSSLGSILIDPFRSSM